MVERHAQVRPVRGGTLRTNEPCVRTKKLRCAPDLFDDWCIVHHHWLNGVEAMNVVDAELARLSSPPVCGVPMGDKDA